MDSLPSFTATEISRTLINSFDTTETAATSPPYQLHNSKHLTNFLQLDTSKSPILDVTESVSLQSDLNDEIIPYNSIPNEINYKHKSIPMTFSNLCAAAAVPFVGTKMPLPAFEYIAPPTNNGINSVDFSLLELNRMGAVGAGAGIFPGFLHRRPRGEKRPIPDEQKDEKYYERRKRNNEAAKKSRDARKIREDRIALRAALLEQENSILRAQVLALRDELQVIRRLLGTGGGSGGVGGLLAVGCGNGLGSG